MKYFFIFCALLSNFIHGSEKETDTNIACYSEETITTYLSTHRYHQLPRWKPSTENFYEPSCDDKDYQDHTKNMQSASVQRCLMNLDEYIKENINRQKRIIKNKMEEAVNQLFKNNNYILDDILSNDAYLYHGIHVNDLSLRIKKFEQHYNKYQK